MWRTRTHVGCSVSPQETGIPEELLVTVVRPGLPTLADLHVLLPPPRPTRKRSLVSDKVSPAATRPGASCPPEGLVADDVSLLVKPPFSPISPTWELALLHG